MTTTKKAKGKLKPVDKSYRLTKEKTFASYLLKVGRNKNLVIYDEEQNTQRAIRHAPNEKSIYLDEQSSYALVQPILFERGALEVSYRKPYTQEFLAKHPDNAANGGNLFEEVNDEIIAEDDINYDELVLDAKQAVRDKAKEKDGVFALEMVVGVITNSVVKASKMETSELKRFLYREIDNNPNYFADENGNINIFDDQAMQRKYVTLRAIKDGILKESANGKSMLWVKTGETIVTAPQGVKIKDHFADYLASEDGMLVIEEIRKRG